MICLQDWLPTLDAWSKTGTDKLGRAPKSLVARTRRRRSDVYTDNFDLVAFSLTDGRLKVPGSICPAT